MKKAKSSWSTCPQCNIILSNRFLKRHEKDHNGDYDSELSDFAGSGDGGVSTSSNAVNKSIVDSLLSPQKSSFEYGFFAGSNLHAVITSSRLEAEPQLPKSMQSYVAFFSPGTMRVGKMAIGDPVAINGKYAFLAWPNDSVPDCFVYIQPNNTANQGPQSLLPAQMCTVNRLPDVIPAAGRVKVRLLQSLSDLPTSVTEDALSGFIKHQLEMKVISPECDICINYFGRPVKIEIVGVVARDSSVANAASLCQDMESLNVTAEIVSNENERCTSLVTSTPVSSRSKMATSSGEAALLEGELAVTSGTFYQVKSTSTITIEGSKTKEDMTATFQSKPVPVAAGVDGILDTLSQLIVEPISKKGMYEKYGVQVPRGALLYGSSGCGKTLIANVIGEKLKGHAKFIALDSSQLWSKHFGETENRLQNIFQQAIESSPAVIFIDDIDVMCPRRERSQSDLEKRVLSSLVAEIDRVAQSKSHYVFILATTNRLEAVDLTLRRPGRIDRELEVPVPSSNQRKQILTTMVGSMLHKLTEADISEIAADCHGYVGADLQSLCREAGLRAMNGEQDGGIDRSHFKHAMSAVQPSAMREIYIDVPKVAWTDIGGLEDLKQSLIQSIIWPLQHADRFTRLGIKPPRGVLMYGPPGCSKTMIAKALATETSLNFISIKGPELFSKWVGDSEKAVREIFRKARSAAPSIVFFDEIDAIAVERGRQQGSSGGVGDRVLAQLLTELDGVEGLNNVNIVAATNRPDIIDKALMRPGRLDRLLYVPLPDEKTRKEIFKIRLKAVPLADGVHLMELVDKTRMYSGAEIVAVCNEAAMRAMQENMDAKVIERDHFLSAIRTIKPQTSDAMVKYYSDYAAGMKK